MERERIRKLYDTVLRPGNDKYARTLRRALALPKAEGIAKALRGKERMEALDLACGRWAYMPAIAEALLLAFPGPRVSLSGADPKVNDVRGVERLAKGMGAELGLERIRDIPCALTGSRSVEHVRSQAGLGDLGTFDIVMSFNYLPIVSIASMDESAIRMLEETAAVPPSMQATIFFRCMRDLLSQEGLAIAVASAEVPQMPVMMADAGLRILDEQENAPEDKDMTLNHRIIIASRG